MPLSHCIFKLWSTFRALVYKLLVEFEQQLIFKVSKAHPGSLCSEQQSSTAEESLAGGRGRSASIEFQGQFFDILKGVASTPSWERDPSHVALSEVSTFFLPVKRVF